MTSSTDCIAIDDSLIDQLIEPFKRALKKSPYYPLCALPAMRNHGVYCLYLASPKGTPYEDIIEPLSPIYIGKSSPSLREGGRTSGLLSTRLKKHARSIDLAENLSTESFLCRLVAISPEYASFTPLIESYFINLYNPLWNTHLTGFGINDPGKGRIGQAPSAWDTLHPGRPFVNSLTGNANDPSKILEGLRAHASA